MTTSTLEIAHRTFHPFNDFCVVVKYDRGGTGMAPFATFTEAFNYVCDNLEDLRRDPLYGITQRLFSADGVARYVELYRKARV